MELKKQIEDFIEANGLTAMSISVSSKIAPTHNCQCFVHFDVPELGSVGCVTGMDATIEGSIAKAMENVAKERLKFSPLALSPFGEIK